MGLSLVSIRDFAYLQQRLVTNTYTNTLFPHLSSSNMGTMIPTPQYSYKERVCLIKEGQYLSCKKMGHTTYDCPKKKTIAVISEDVSKNSDSHEKE